MKIELHHPSGACCFDACPGVWVGGYPGVIKRLHSVYLKLFLKRNVKKCTFVKGIGVNISFSSSCFCCFHKLPSYDLETLSLGLLYSLYKYCQ